MKMRALQAFTYNQQDLKPGDMFDTKTGLHAQIFVESRRAEYLGTEKKAVNKATGDEPGDETANDIAQTESADSEKTPRRGRPRKAGKKVGALTSRRSGLVHRYRRTDLEAEDS